MQGGGRVRGGERSKRGEAAGSQSGKMTGGRVGTGRWGGDQRGVGGRYRRG